MSTGERSQHSDLWLILCFFLWCAAAVWLQHMRLEAGVHYEYEDDALYLQMLHLVGDGLVPHNTIHPLHRPSHFTPAYFALWPLFNLLGGGWTAAFILKALAIGGAAFPIYSYARQRVAPNYAFGLALAWLLCAPTLSLVQSTLRPLLFATGPLMGMLLSYADGRFRSTMLWAAIVLACREDLALTVALLSIVALIDRRPWRWIIWPMVTATIWFLVSTQIVLPLILPADYGRVILSSNLDGKSPLWHRPFELSHTGAVLSILASFAFLSLRSKLTLCGGVGAAAILLNREIFTANLMHLTMPLIVAAFAGAVCVVTTKNTGRRLGILVLAILAIHAQPIIPPTVHVAPIIRDTTAGPPLTAWSPVHPAHSAVSEQDIARHTATSAVPIDASVAAVGHLLPWLSPRQTLLEYGHGYAHFAEAEWAVLEANLVTTESGGHISLNTIQLDEHLALLHNAGWVTVAEHSGVHVLKRLRPPKQGLEEQLRRLTTGARAPSPEETTRRTD